MTTAPDIIVYGALWCPDCRRTKQFLAEHRIPYHWIDIDQYTAAQHIVRRLNDGRQIIPTIVFDDGGPALIEPSNSELAARLGISPQASRSYYDLIIVGSGPAGLTAAIYAAREGMDTLVIERGGVGGQGRIHRTHRQLPRLRSGHHRGRVCRPNAGAGRAFRSGTARRADRGVHRSW